ncbi:hypothetical protein EW146_g3169 [Bondarzewia mesenterica]|uniref:Lipid droplet-associated perilipin protein n=1 Tax=Bondarzewia mesenterica TaxID=1095465 RepID=A0A4S4M0P0_9AGAM|nr:hypothetical protein EW146_g3169 [Bondarzewia mesenterica]
MATETQSPPTPEITVISRVASIPLVNDSLAAAYSTVSSNPYTLQVYNTAHAISSSAVRYSEPLASRLAPLIVRADGFANKAVDAVEQRYPYPFKTPTGEIYNDLKGSADHAKGYATKTLDDKVKNPAVAVAQGIDQRFAPLVDYFAVAVSRIHQNATGESSSPAASSDAKYQYQRAYALSVDLKDQIYVYSNDQIKHLQQQNALVQKAIETGQNISNLASSSVVVVQNKVHNLSDTMVQELHKIQTSTASLPAHLQSSFKPLSDALGATITDLSSVLKSDLPMNEKVGKLGVTVQERVQPVLEAARTKVQETIHAISTRAEGAKAQAKENANGADH